MNRRRGKTLIELMVVISLMGTMLATTGTVIHRLMRAERAVANDLAWTRAVTELAEQFRSDAHAATQCRVSDDGQTLEFTLAEASIMYRLTKPGVERIATPVAASSHRDTYRLGPEPVQFVSTAEQGRRWIEVQIPRGPTVLTAGASTPAKLPPLAIRAVVGRFRVSVPDGAAS